MPKTIIDKNLANKAKVALANLKQYGVIANRLKAIISAHNHGINKVSKILDIDRTSIFRWANKLNQQGHDSLANIIKHKDGIKLKKYHKEQIKLWMNSDPNVSIMLVKTRLEDQFNLLVSKSTVHRAMKSVGFSYITPRKNHYKQDKEEVNKFKKNSN